MCSAAGPGVKVRLHAEQRQSCTISSFFLRVPRRVRLWPPQYGRASGCLAGQWNAGDARDGGDILLIVCAHRIMQLTEIEKQCTHIGVGVGHGFLEGVRAGVRRRVVRRRDVARSSLEVPG